MTFSGQPSILNGTSAAVFGKQYSGEGIQIERKCRTRHLSFYFLIQDDFAILEHTARFQRRFFCHFFPSTLFEKETGLFILNTMQVD